MKKLLILCTCLALFWASLGHAQSNEVLLKLLAEADSLRDYESEFKASFEKSSQALQIAEKLSGNLGLAAQADCLIRMGRAQKGQGHYENALSYLNKALIIRRDNLKDPGAAARTYNTIAGAELEIGDKQAARLHLKRAIDLMTGVPDSAKYLVKFYNTLSNIYREFDNLDSVQLAIKANQHSVLLFEMADDTSELVRAEYGMAIGYLRKDSFAMARQCLQVALKFNKLLGEHESEILSGQILEAAGVSFLNSSPPKLDSALHYFKKVELIFLENEEAKPQLANLYYNLSVVYELQENWDKAIKASKSSLDYYDAEYSEIPDIEGYLNMQIKLFKQNQNQVKKEIQLTLALVSILTCLLIILILLYRNAKIEKDRAISEAEKAKILEELNQLRHDVIKNNLVIISDHIENHIKLHGQTGTPDIHLGQIFKIRKRLRRLLFFSHDPKHIDSKPTTLRPFILEMHELAEDVLNNNQSVLNKTIYEKIEDIPINDKQQRELGLFITECFTNIRKHAKCKNASIAFDANFEILKLFIEDDGIGFDPDEYLDNNGHGLQNLRDRATRMGWQMEINSEKGKGTNIQIQVPLI